MPPSPTPRPALPATALDPSTPRQAQAQPLSPLATLDYAASGPRAKAVAGPPLAAPVFSADHVQCLADAKARLKRIRRACGVARFDGNTLAIFAVLTLIFGFTSASGVVMGLGLGAIAWFELHQAKRLERLATDAPRALAVNQVMLASLLVVYALWCLLFPAALPAEVVSAARQLKSLGLDVEELQASINSMVYLALIAVAIGAQGSLALYYWRREKMLKTYLEQTPEWVVAMQRAGVVS